jgi:NAD dependent epimerase/dehydratase
MWTGKRVLVAGAAGFIGSHLTERLVSLGANTRALVHYNSGSSWGWLDTSPLKDEIEVVLGDIQDQGSLERAMKGVDVVYHLAALIAIPYSYQAPLSYIQTNVVGTMNLMQSAIANGVGLIVHTSTSEVYGSAIHVPISEEHPLQGQSPYSASKIGADKMVEAFHRSFGLQTVTVRPFNTYGPRQSARAVIPTIITQALTQDAINLGNLEPTRDLNFVEDTVEGFVAAAGKPAAIGEVVNIGTGKEISIGDLARTILRITGRNIPIKCDTQRLRPERSEVDRLCADNSKAKELLGWQPRYSLEHGLSKTVEWLKEHNDRYRPEAYTV